jgi:hypothetical protein
MSGCLEKVQRAFREASEATDQGEPYRNPLDDGGIIILSGGGPFRFIPGPGILEGEAQQHQPVAAQARDQNAMFPRADLTFELSDLLPLPELPPILDLNE